jgi:hypothetical protein
VSKKTWKIEIEFEESEWHTRADALLEAGALRYRAFGRAKRNPIDPDRPRVGEEIAAARALESLAVQLQRVAEHEIEDHEGHPVEIQL